MALSCRPAAPLAGTRCVTALCRWSAHVCPVLGGLEMAGNGHPMGTWLLLCCVLTLKGSSGCCCRCSKAVLWQAVPRHAMLAHPTLFHPIPSCATLCYPMPG